MRKALAISCLFISIIMLILVSGSVEGIEVAGLSGGYKYELLEKRGRNKNEKQNKFYFLGYFVHGSR